MLVAQRNVFREATSAARSGWGGLRQAVAGERVWCERTRHDAQLLQALWEERRASARAARRANKVQPAGVGFWVSDEEAGLPGRR